MTDHIINRERLAKTFVQLCEISSPARSEKNLASHLRECFTALGADSVIEDDSKEATGSNSGNLIIRFNGNMENTAGMFFSCHMDTVQPGEGVKVVRTGDIFTSEGETILGSDDKSGIAALIELITVLRDSKADHGLIEIILTTCEEVGLLGAKSLDAHLIQADYGYALDSTGINQVITGAPAANKFKVEVKGLAAHAGINPEDGINAVQVAAKAVANLRLGRLDEQSTANFGLISGGVATNIVPELVTLEGEVRSHSPEKLAAYSKEIEDTFHNTIETWTNPDPKNTNKPSVKITTMAEYPAMSIDPDSPVIRRIQQAGKSTGKELKFKLGGGGSDANILNGYGLPTAIVSTGMDKVHTINEQLNLGDLVSVTELLYELVTAAHG